MARPVGKRSKHAQWRRNRAQRLRRAKWFREQKDGKPCTDCDTPYPFYVMQFDHVPGRGEKLFELNYGAVVNKGLVSLEREIEKCDLVCANCHAIRTWERAQEKLDEPV